MKQVLFHEQALLQLEDSVQQLVEKGYFSEEFYAVDYVRDIFRYFSLNLTHLVARRAPEYFNRYCVDGKDLYYVAYSKSNRTTWYAFYEELENAYSVVYLGNNQFIGHHLDLTI